MKITERMGLSLLVIGFIGFIVSGLEAATINVNCDTGMSVQSALDGLTGPATIVVTGTCKENIDIMKDDVTIQGGTFVGSDPQQTTIYVEGARRILITGATVRGAGAGVTASQGASLTLNHSVIEGNARQGVVVTDNSALILTNSTIKDNGAAGVLAQRSSSARIGQSIAGVSGPNMITNNGGGGVSVFRSAYALIDRNTITANSFNGVNIEGGSVTVTNNTIQGNHKKGIAISSSGNARIGITEGDQPGPNTIENNSYEGIEISNSGAAYIFANTIRNNGTTTYRPGVAINRATGRLIGDNTIQGNGGHGVSVSLGALFQGAGDLNLTAGPDIITANQYSGISGWNGASLDIRHARIYGNNENGIVLNLRSTLRIYDSTVYNNLHHGIRVYRGSAVILSTDGPLAGITGNVDYGVFCDDKESSLAGDESGVTGNGAGQTHCTGF